MKKNYYISLSIILAVSLMFNSCSLIVLPKYQKKIEIKTNNPEAKVYIDNEFVGQGENIVIPKTLRNGFKQVVVKAPKQKTSYYVMAPEKLSTGWWVTLPIDIVLLPVSVGVLHFGSHPKYWSYNKVNEFNEIKSVPEKAETYKEVNYLATKVNIENTNESFKSYRLTFNKDIEKEMQKAEDKQYAFDEKLAKKQQKRGVVETLDKKEILEFDDTYFSVEIIETLKEGGFIDTTGTAILKNKSDILSLESTIVGGKVYNIYKKGTRNLMYRLKLDIDWKFKNSYGQLIDSVRLTESSGFFTAPWTSDYLQYGVNKKQTNQKMFQDAVNNSFYALTETDLFKKHIQKDIKSSENKELLSILKPTSIVLNPKDALKASVTIRLDKNKGHGSGFAISEDGYILTNFHVISGKKVGEYEKFDVIMPDGTSKTAEVIRVDVLNDIALLKIEGIFEKSFLLTDEKKYDILDEVYTVGTPVSIDLGSTITLGILSGERKVDDIDLLQLSMAISPGNSGGALFSKEGGMLFGVISSKISGAKVEGISFAIPAYKIQKFLNLGYK